MGINIKEMFGNIFPKKTKNRKVKVSEAREMLVEMEAEKLVDMDKVQTLAKERTEQNGIIFIDEIDKIASREGGHGPEVSATSCRSLKAARSTPSMVRSRQTTSSLLRPARSMLPNLRI
jgi:ATP-dependent protease HslVU (ClpYQ) ATPase subunit